MKVLVACEFSGRVRDAFLKRGHDAWSCDLLPTEVPGPHIQDDVLKVIDSRPWDLLVAHPPCTFLANSGAKHLYIGGRRENGRDEERWENMIRAVVLFRKLLFCKVPKKCVENPIMHGAAAELIGFRADQIIQPWWFGHKEMKATGLHLEGLPKLTQTRNVGPPPEDPQKRKSWAVVHRASPGPDRWKLRSRTYPGIADAMGLQWGGGGVT
jgi:hypothetical protein